MLYTGHQLHRMRTGIRLKVNPGNAAMIHLLNIPVYP